MPEKKHPSDTGTQLARVFARMLYRKIGSRLEGVFVHGSSSLGMRLPASDVDIIVVKKDAERMVSPTMPEFQLTEQLINRFGINIEVCLLDAAEFERMRDPAYRSTTRFFNHAITGLRKGAIAVFGKKEFLARSGFIKAPGESKVLEYAKHKANFGQRQSLRNQWKRTVGVKRVA